MQTWIPRGLVLLAPLKRLWQIVVVWTAVCALLIILPFFAVNDLPSATFINLVRFDLARIFSVVFVWTAGLVATIVLGRWITQQFLDVQIAQQLLHENEARFRTMAESAYDWEYWRAPDGKIIYCSPSSERITSYTAAEFQADPDLLIRIIHSDDLVRVQSHITAVEQGCSSDPLDFRILWRDGQIRWIAHVCQPIRDAKGKLLGTHATNRDMTDRHISEDQLQLQTAALQSAGGAILITDPHSKIIFANSAFTRLTGYAIPEALGKTPGDLLKSGKQDKLFYKTLWETVRAGRVWQGELINRRKDGTLYTEEMTITPVRASDGAITHFVAVKQDMTARKDAEIELARAHTLLRAAFDSATEGIIAIGLNGHVGSFNQRFLEMWRASEEQLSVPFEEQLAYCATQVKDPVAFTEHIHKIINNPVSALTDIFEMNDGRLIERTITPYSLGGYVVGQLWSCRDISEHRRIASDLQTERDFAMQIINTMGQGLTVTDREGRFILVNPAYARLFGYAPEDLLGKHPHELTYPEDLPTLSQARSDREMGNTTTYENRLHRKDGTLAHVLITGSPRVIDGHYAGAIAVITDLTEHKHAEQALLETQARFRMLADNAPVLIWMSEPDGLYSYFNKPWLEFTGRTVDQELGKGWVESVHPDDVASILETWQLAFGARERFRMEYRLRRADGQYRWIIDTGVPRFLADGTFAGYIGSGIDITERKHIEHLLQTQRDLAIKLGATSDLNDALGCLLSAALESGGVDCGGVYLFNSLTGGLDLAVHRGLSAEFIATSSHYLAGTSQVALVQRGKPIYRPYNQVHLLDDPIQQGEGLRALAVVPVMHDGKVVAVLNLASHVFNDIPLAARTAIEAIAAQIGSVLSRIRVEQALIESQKDFQMLFDTVDDFLFILDGDGRIAHGNTATASRLEYTPKELSRMHVLQVHPPDRRDEASTIIAAMLNGKETSCHVPLLTKSGALVPVETKVTRGQWNGKPALFGISRDITERRRIEMALSQSEARFRSIFESSPIAIEVYDQQGQLLEANPACLALFGVTDFESVRGFRLFQDPNVSEENKADLRAGKTVRVEMLFDFDLVITNNLYPTNKRGKIFLDVLFTPLKLDPLSSIAHYLVQFQDISERKRFEARLEYSSMHDALTGLYNRAFFDEEVARLVSDENDPVGVLMVDVDFMKTTNDVYGHAAGDDLLRRTGQVLHRVFRSEDIVARIGGDEFVVLLPKSDWAITLQAVRRVRQALAIHNADTDAVPLSFSIGAATCGTAEGLRQTLIDADAAMYAEKAQKHTQV
jgi:diguanylate cyclase (GGDEF)-like protein/PAS domain S-box-containing protein